MRLGFMCGFLLVAELLVAGPGCSGDVAGPNRAPVAVAGPDQAAAVGAMVALDGRASYDPDGDSLVYLWELVAAPDGASAVPEQAGQPVAELTPDRPGVWVIKLMVSDGALESEPDLVQVRAIGETCESDAQCDDGLYCTDDACVNRSCEHLPTDCSGVENQCNGSTCNEDIDACEQVSLPDGTACGDQLWCTENDACDQGTCTGTPRDCSSVAEECEVGICNDITDQCEAEAVANNTNCDDGLYCTEGEKCTNGVCGGGLPKDCSSASGGCIDGMCDEESDSCVGAPKPQGAVCNDDDWCTVQDACDGVGNCLGNPRNCSAYDGQCTQGACDGDIPTCYAQPINEGYVCDDGLYCSVGETCQAGSCLGIPNGCDDGDECTQDSCDDVGDKCDHLLVPQPGEEGLAVPGTCSDGEDNDCDRDIDLEDTDCQACTIDGDCDDGFECTVNTCNQTTFQCETANQPDGTGCDDGQNCTDNDQCTGGVCGGSPVDCSGLTDQCNLGVCDPADGQCQAQPINEGMGCEDGDFCLVNETCQSGNCTGGINRDCSHLDDQCNDGVCNETSDQCEKQPANEGQSCEDGEFCTDGDICQSGTCAGGGPRDCSALSDQCNDGVCDEDADQCTAQAKPLGEPCDDDVFCNGTDQCNGNGFCNINAGNPCLPGSDCNRTCNEGDENCWDAEGTGCGSFNATDCDDADTCDNQGNCLPNHWAEGATCGEQSFDDCDDPDSCNDSGVCLQNLKPPGTPCGDPPSGDCDAQDACDGAGVCEALVAEPGDPCGGLPVDACDAQNTCDAAGVCQVNYAPEGVACGDDNDTDCDNPDSCDGLGGCLDNYEDPGHLCDDSNLCTVNDDCDGGGLCQGDDITTIPAPAGCDDGNPCTDDGCNPADGSCTTGYNTDFCNDGYACTDPDQCDGAGNCSGTPNHGNCAPGYLCWPQCSVALDGCLESISSLTLACDDPVDLTSSDISTCTMLLTDGRNTGQVNCLSCSSEVGLVVVDHTDFGDGTGTCDPNHWSFVPPSEGDVCRDHAENCAQGGGGRRCCDDLSKICPCVAGNCLMLADKRLGCGGDNEEWRMSKSFDFTGLSEVEINFWVGSINTNDAKHNIHLYVYDPDHPIDPSNPFYCFNADPALDPPDIVGDGVLYPVRRLFPDWTDNNPGVVLMFLGHSNANDRIVLLDDILIQGWTQSCAPSYIPDVLVEDFTGCPDPIPDGWNGWTVDGEAKCNSGFDCYNGSDRLFVSNSAIIERIVDASGLDGDVRLCFSYGSVGADNGEAMSVEYSVNGGTDWLLAWGHLGAPSLDSQCREFCFNLSAIDPRVNRNPNLGIRIDLKTDGSGELHVDHIVLSGAQYCDGTGTVDIGPISDEGGGSYNFLAQDVPGFRLDADIMCEWDPDPAMSDDFTVHYQTPWSGWRARRALRFDNSSQSEDLVDFPVPVVLEGGTNIDYDKTQDQGHDLRFFSRDLSMRLDHEIERWDESGTSVVWVRVPLITGGSNDETIWMYYDNPKAPDAQNPAGVWDQHFVGVWHLAEASGPAVDSTGNGNDGVYQGPGLQFEGDFGDYAAYFDGNNDYVDLGTMDVYSASGDDGITLEAYAIPISPSSDRRLISKAGGDDTEDHWWMLSINDGGPLRFRVKLDGDTHTTLASSGDVSNGTWFYAAVTYEGTSMRLYKDGNPVGNEAESGTVSTDDTKSAWIGANPPNSSNPYDPWWGRISEVRISNIGRSADWIAAQSMCMRDDSFVSYGPEETP